MQTNDYPTTATYVLSCGPIVFVVGITGIVVIESIGLDDCVVTVFHILSQGRWTNIGNRYRGRLTWRYQSARRCRHKARRRDRHGDTFGDVVRVYDDGLSTKSKVHAGLSIRLSTTAISSCPTSTKQHGRKYSVFSFAAR